MQFITVQCSVKCISGYWTALISYVWYVLSCKKLQRLHKTADSWLSAVQWSHLAISSVPPTRQLAVSLFGNMIGKMRNTYEHQRVRRLPWPLWSGCETLNGPQISEKWLKWTFFWQISSPMHLNLLLDGSHGLWVLRGGVGSGFLLKLRDFLNYEFQGSICFEFISYFSTSASKICCHHCYIAMHWTALLGWWKAIPMGKEKKFLAR